MSRELSAIVLKPILVTQTETVKGESGMKTTQEVEEALDKYFAKLRGSTPTTEQAFRSGFWVGLLAQNSPEPEETEKELVRSPGYADDLNNEKTQLTRPELECAHTNKDFKSINNGERYRDKFYQCRNCGVRIEQFEKGRTDGEK